MKIYRKHFFRSLLNYFTSTIVSIPFCIGLPILFFMLWFNASRANGTGGDLFYFPTTLPEFIWLSSFLIFSLPFIVSNVLFSFPVYYLLHYIGSDLNNYTYELPIASGHLNLGGSSFIALFPALIIQIMIWGSLFHLIRLRIQANRNS